MQLTRNDKRVLKFLIENGRASDVDMARKLSITFQAVGKIRKKLETEGYIKSYTTEVDYEKLGIKVFAVVLFKYMPEVWKSIKSDEDVSERIKGPHIMDFYRVPEGDVTHIVVYGFRSLDELDNYFHMLQTERGHISEIRKMYVFSSKSMIKRSAKELVSKVIDEIGKETLARPLKPKL
jgi:Lrp/AsnC family leucine-responsive transcriptional regulator